MTPLLIILVSLLSSGAQLCQKQATQKAGRRHQRLWLGLSLILLTAGLLLWLLVLQRVDVSVAYPMLSLNFILVPLAARALWQEPIADGYWPGVMLIVIGVMLAGGAL
ncbi:4-amino-4-deoxy-L-arabinose-phosphoundecaprenol flippase subunit ArnE [[Erwinia] mediterraneensis]|uniref:4-amino-4-deoxy-L-arabinose-phosphoundecaprenol flippase subunit ArnE n=1 Tax=[Erwinia] mediterraneensis TaxID=2161819 RepID=UPI001031908F|nr:4-amino-4-deoxy-L-arabinose-phosphoundecaprenol flippase subunit ArnE [[Erwinia] mediterraneensis]